MNNELKLLRYFENEKKRKNVGGKRGLWSGSGQGPVGVRWMEGGCEQSI